MSNIYLIAKERNVYFFSFVFQRLGLDDETISTQEEVWTEKNGRVTWIRSSWLSFSDKFTWVEMEVYEPLAENHQK